jgi:hypothetical protein
MRDRENDTGEPSRSTGTANCKKSAFCARNSDRRGRTILARVVNYRREVQRDERSGLRISTWRSRCNAVASLIASGTCTLVQTARRPKSCPLLMRSGSARWSRRSSTICPRDRVLCAEFKVVERPLFRCVQMLENCCRGARKCKETGRSNRRQTRRRTLYVVFEIGRSGLRCTALPGQLERCTRRPKVQSAITHLVHYRCAVLGVSGQW